MPKEFTEGTGSGPILSVIAAVVMGALFVLEFKDFMKVTSVTDLVMDPGGVDGNDMYIAFKVSMPDLVCQFASIEVVDGMGTERQGIHKDMNFKRLDEEGCEHSQWHPKSAHSAYLLSVLTACCGCSAQQHHRRLHLGRGEARLRRDQGGHQGRRGQPH